MPGQEAGPRYCPADSAYQATEGRQKQNMKACLSKIKEQRTTTTKTDLWVHLNEIQEDDIFPLDFNSFVQRILRFRFDHFV